MALRSQSNGCHLPTATLPWPINANGLASASRRKEPLELSVKKTSRAAKPFSGSCEEAKAKTMQFCRLDRPRDEHHSEPAGFRLADWFITGVVADWCGIHPFFSGNTIPCRGRTSGWRVKKSSAERPSVEERKSRDCLRLQSLPTVTRSSLIHGNCGTREN